MSQVLLWYLQTHYGSADDPGLPSMFCDNSRIGTFAVSADEFARAEPSALFGLLIAMIMFQRRQDVQIMRILRGMAPSVAAEITSQRTLLMLVDRSPCDLLATLAALQDRCDLTKEGGHGTCVANPLVACHLKRHTEAMKRYGHFGKFPTSAALVLRESGAQDLNAIYTRVLIEHRSCRERAIALEASLSRIHRVSQKIACMFLSAVSNPNLGAAPWRDGLDYRYFVVIDSNVDLFLHGLGYCGRASYDARRQFIIDVADRIDPGLFERRHRKRVGDPRVVQQAMYLFMSASNRRSLAGDCVHAAGAKCISCPRSLRRRCPVRHLAPWEAA